MIVSLFFYIFMMLRMEEDYLYKDETYKVIGACIEVHNKPGQGLLEAVYQKALETELSSRDIPFKSKVKLDVYYDEVKLNKIYVADMICYDTIIIEIKATSFLIQDHFKQLLNYLKATNYKLGLLVNFGGRSLKVKRIINS